MEPEPSEPVKVLPAFTFADAEEYTEMAALVLKNRASNDIEKAEAFEIAGSLQYYVGQYYLSVVSFAHATNFRDKSTKVRGITS